jgi:hypothetical protein
MEVVRVCRQIRELSFSYKQNAVSTKQRAEKVGERAACGK